MTDIAIRAEGLGKRYRIGVAEDRHDTLREAIMYAARSPFRNLRRLRRLTHFSESENDDDVVWALRDVSFEVPRGQVLGIIGKNGAGKSTLLKIMSGVTEPSTGRAVLEGEAGALLEVGTGFHPELTGRENIYLNGAILGMDRDHIDDHLDEIIEFADLAQFIDTPIKRYSSGMKVRLAFAVAAHLDPEILIIDEVLAVGDVGFQKKCLGKMESVARSGRTILFVSHDMGAITALCERCVLIEDGRLVDDGPADEVVDHYVARFEDELRTEDDGAIPADPNPGWMLGSGEGYFLHPRRSRSLSVRCGEPVAWQFDVEAPESLKELTVGLSFSLVAGGRVVTMSSKVQNVASAPGSSRFWDVRCDLGKIPLNAGQYVATVHIGNGERDIARFGDVLHLEVRPHDVFGWGNSIPERRHWGPMYWAPEWRIEPKSGS